MAAKKELSLKATDKPDSELVVIMLNTGLDEAYEKLRLKYGDYSGSRNPDNSLSYALSEN